MTLVKSLYNTSVPDPDPDPDPPDPNVSGLPDPGPDSFIRCMDRDPDPSISKQKY